MFNNCEMLQNTDVEMDINIISRFKSKTEEPTMKLQTKLEMCRSVKMNIDSICLNFQDGSLG